MHLSTLAQLGIYLTLINLISFIMMGIDKYKAIKHRYRISEFFLITTGFLGGSVGVITGMVIFKHKLSKIKFRALMPISLCIYWIAILWAIFKIS